jgi:hypothetical protein
LGRNDWEICIKGFKSKKGKTAAAQLKHDWWEKEVLSKMWSPSMPFEEGWPSVMFATKIALLNVPAGGSP